MRLRDFSHLPIVAIKHDDKGADLAHDCPLCGERFWRREGTRTPRLCPPCHAVVRRESDRETRRAVDARAYAASKASA